MARKWFAVFSHTGSEIAAVSKHIGREPDAILTTNYAYKGLLNVAKGYPAFVNAFLEAVAEDAPGCLITLHGYRHLIPADVLKLLYAHNCTCLNIHPAPIWRYPELRGIDPHKRLYEGVQADNYHIIGVTIHHVDEGIDTGMLYHSKQRIALPQQSFEEMCSVLHDMGTDAWCEILPELLEGVE